MAREVPPFRYMVWAKDQALGQARHHLGASGLAPPPAELLDASAACDLSQRGHHMPPEARRRLADRYGVDPRELMLTLGTSLPQNVEGDVRHFSLHYIDWQYPENNVYHVTEEFVVERTSSHQTRCCSRSVNSKRITVSSPINFFGSILRSR